MSLQWYSLTFPRDLDAAVVQSFVRSLSTGRMFRMFGTRMPSVFEVEHFEGGIVWRLGLSPALAGGAIANLRSLAPGITVQPIDRPNLAGLSYGWELRLHHPFLPLRTDVAGQTSAGMLHALAAGHTTERIVVQWTVGGCLPRRRTITRPNRSDSWLDAALGTEDRFVERDDQAPLNLKQSEPVFAAVGRIALAGADGPRSRDLVARVFGAHELIRVPGNGFRRRRLSARHVARRTSLRVMPWGAWPCSLNALELASLIGWPIDGPIINGVHYRTQRQLPADHRVLRPAGTTFTGRSFGEATFPGRGGLLVQKPTDSLMHTWALGPSGQGKSTLLGNLVLQDIAQGRGTILIEPKGDLVRDVLARLDDRRLDDVVVLDAADPVAPVGLNVLRSGSAELAADTILSILRGLYGENIGPRTADVVQAGLLTLAHDPGASLVSLPILLTDPAYQRRLVPKAAAADPWGLRPFWAWYQAMSDDQRATVLAPVMNKLRGLLLRSSLRRVLGQPNPKFDVRQVFTERKVLLVSLGAGTIGSEGASLLGSLLMGVLWQTIQSRGAIPPEHRHPVGLVADEFQMYLHLPTDFADILAAARSYGVGLVAAHQHLAQLTPSVRAAMANAQSRVLFRLHGDDAAAMAKTSRLLSSDDLEGLDRYETYISLVADGAATPYGSARTLALPEPHRKASEVIERSRRRFGTPVAEIDAAHRALVDPPEVPQEAPEVPGRRRRRTS